MSDEQVRAFQGAPHAAVRGEKPYFNMQVNLIPLLQSVALPIILQLTQY